MSILKNLENIRAVCFAKKSFLFTARRVHVLRTCFPAVGISECQMHET